MYHEITAVGMRNVMAGFGKYELEEIGQEFKSTANSTEKNYILLQTVGGTKVHFPEFGPQLHFCLSEGWGLAPSYAMF